MNLNKFIHTLLIILLSIGIIGAGGLVLDEIQTGNGCPKIGIIPACVIVLICFIIPLISHILKKWNVLYFFFTGLALAIAVFASIMQLLNKGECPKLDSGMPMCYVSFIIFLTLIILKIVYIKNNQNKIN